MASCQCTDGQMSESVIFVIHSTILTVTVPAVIVLTLYQLLPY